MFDAETRELLRAVLDEVCGNADEYQNATRAHVTSEILGAAGQESAIIDHLREVGRAALKTAPCDVALMCAKKDAVNGVFARLSLPSRQK